MSWRTRFFGRHPVKETEQRELPLPAPDGFADGVEAFAWRILVDGYSRVLARNVGSDYLSMRKQDLQAMLLPYHADIERDARAMAAAIAQARAEGVQLLQRALHRAEGLDHEMVDQAIAFAFAQTKARKQEA